MTWVLQAGGVVVVVGCIGCHDMGFNLVFLWTSYIVALEEGYVLVYIWGFCFGWGVYYVLVVY